MKIYGLQKLTLLDYPQKTACTIFTGGCNFACPFCHNASLVTHIDGEVIPQSELLSFLDKRKNMLEGVCISGGEPLLNDDLPDFIVKVKEFGYAVKLDTNGSFHEKLKSLIDKKLIDYVAMDIKNCREKYNITAGASVDIEKIEKSVKLLLKGKIPYEFRTTVTEQLHCDSDFEKIGDWLFGAEKYYLQTYQDSDDIIAKGLTAPTPEILSRYQKILENKIKSVFIRK